MAEYKFVFRGEGIIKYAATGERLTAADFFDALKFTPEPLLDEPHARALLLFLRNVPPPAKRRTKTQKTEARRLIGLIGQSRADAFLPEAVEHLCVYLSGDAPVKRARPVASLAQQAQKSGEDVLLMALEEAVDAALLDPGGHHVVQQLRCRLDEEPEWRTLSHSLRVMTIVQAILRMLGKDPPAIATLRNRLSLLRRRNPPFIRE